MSNADGEEAEIAASGEQINEENEEMEQSTEESMAVKAEEEEQEDSKEVEEEAEESKADVSMGFTDESTAAVAQEDQETTGEIEPAVNMECESDTGPLFEGESMTARVRRKIAARSKAAASVADEVDKTPDSSPKKRKRGRPRKSETVETIETETEGEETEVVPLRSSSRRSAQFATRRMKKFVKDLRRGDFVDEDSDEAEFAPNSDEDGEDDDFDPQSDGDLDELRKVRRRFPNVKDVKVRMVDYKGAQSIKSANTSILSNRGRKKGAQVKFKKKAANWSARKVDRNPNSPIGYFFRQYSMLQTTIRASKRLAVELRGEKYDTTADDDFDAYGMLTYASKLFVRTMAALIKESFSNFSLEKWDPTSLDDVADSLAVTRTEAQNASRYLEDLFGKLPSNAYSSLYDTGAKRPGVNGRERRPGGMTFLDKKRGFGRNLKSSKAAALVKRSLMKSKPKPLQKKNSELVVVKGDDGKSRLKIGDLDIEMNISDTLAANLKEIKVPERTAAEQEEARNDDTAVLDDDDGAADDSAAAGDTTADTSTALQTAVMSSGDATEKRIGLVRQLYCIYCMRKNFRDIREFTRHYTEVHLNSIALDFLLGSTYSSSAVKFRMNKVKAAGKKPLSYIKCGLCTFFYKQGEIRKGKRLGVNDLYMLYIEHYKNTHNPRHSCCDHCDRRFFVESVAQEHRLHCKAAVEKGAIETPADVSELAFYKKKRCGLHKTDFSDEFASADHLIAYHIHEVDGGEVAQLLNLSVKDLLYEYNRRLGIKYVCHMCGLKEATFKEPYEWIAHVEAKHSGRSYCDVCCQFVGSLKQHMKHTHGTRGESYFMCIVEACRYRGAGFPSLYQHMLHAHSDISMEVPHDVHRRCVECDFTILYKFDKKLIDYSKITTKMTSHHTSEHMKQFCERCGKMLPAKQMKIHMEVHEFEDTGQHKYRCKYCGREFMHRKSLREHEERHDESNRTHLCDICSKAFFTQHELNKHFKMQHCEKMLQCQFCAKPFAMNQHLRRHEMRCPKNPESADKEETVVMAGGEGMDSKRKRIVIIKRAEELENLMAAKRLRMSHDVDENNDYNNVTYIDDASKVDVKPPLLASTPRYATVVTEQDGTVGHEGSYIEEAQEPMSGHYETVVSQQPGSSYNVATLGGYYPMQQSGGREVTTIQVVRDGNNQTILHIPTTYSYASQ